MVNNWCREYHLKYVKEYFQALVQVLDAENIGDKPSAGASVSRLLALPLLILYPKTTGPKPV